MKTHPITAVLTSVYLSAMLTSSLAPIRNNAIFAAAVDPMAAQKALQNAVTGLDAAGWAAAVASTPSVDQSPPTPVPVKVAPKTDPTMTDELMARLIKLVRESEEPSTIPADICALFNLCDGKAPMPVKLLETDNPPGLYFTIPRTPGAKDIIIIHKLGPVLEAYLTDKNYKLRAAAITDSTGTRLIVNEKAAEKFKAELSHLAREAADLPPTGTAVAGNS